jgi:hypothetical protein
MTRILLIACAMAVQNMASAQVTLNPWFGTWELRLKAADEKPETLVYSDAGNGAMRMVSVEEKSVIVTRFDGKPAIDIGPRGSGEPTLAVKALSPTSYSWTFYRHSKPYVRGVNTLAADLKTFTEVSWLISEPGKTVTLTYDRR